MYLRLFYIHIENWLKNLIESIPSPNLMIMGFLCLIVLIIACIIINIIPKKLRCCGSIFVLIACFYTFFNQYEVETNRYTIELGLEKPVKVVQLSDLHYNTSMPYCVNEAIKKCNEENPDIVVITGDFITSLGHNTIPKQCFKSLRKIKCDRIYAVYGNHDQFFDRKETEKEFEDAGIKIIDGKEEKIGRNFYIAGAKYRGVHCDELNKTLKALPKNSKSIVLTHHPACILLDQFNSKYIKNKNILFLTGHTHGGQFLLPWTDKETFAQNKFYINRLNGMTEILGNKVYISKGIGTSIIPLRLNARPEIGVFEIK